MPILRPCSGALATALAAGNIKEQADLFTLTLQSGTSYHATSYDTDLTVGAQLFASASSNIFFSRGPWRIVNTMEVPNLEVTILAENGPTFVFGGPSFKILAHNGLLDGATLFLQRVYMPTPGDTTTYGTVDLFSGDVGQVVLSEGAKVVLKVRGKNSRLNVPTPLNVYQPGCIHTFCDAGCTLSAATFTVSTTVSVGTRTVVKVNAVPTPNSQTRGGTLTMTSGAAATQFANIIQVSLTTSLVLAKPLTVAPAPGDTCTVFLGCDKTLTTCDATYSNKVNFRGFPFMPRPSTTAVGQ